MNTERNNEFISADGVMAATQVLGTCVFGRGGSSPSRRTNYIASIAQRTRAIAYEAKGRGFESL